MTPKGGTYDDHIRCDLIILIKTFGVITWLCE